MRDKTLLIIDKVLQLGQTLLLLLLFGGPLMTVGNTLHVKCIQMNTQPFFMEGALTN